MVEEKKSEGVNGDDAQKKVEAENSVKIPEGEKNSTEEKKN